MTKRVCTSSFCRSRNSCFISVEPRVSGRRTVLTWLLSTRYDSDQKPKKINKALRADVLFSIQLTHPAAAAAHGTRAMLSTCMEVCEFRHSFSFISGCCHRRRSYQCFLPHLASAGDSPRGRFVTRMKPKIPLSPSPSLTRIRLVLPTHASGSTCCRSNPCLPF